MSKRVLSIAICIATTCWCQTPAAKPTAAGLLAKLHSKYWAERSDALDQIRSDQALLHSRKIQVVLIDLLDQENRGQDKSPNGVNAASGDDNGNEEYAEYFASLRDAVNSFADWSDARQACILVYAGSNDYPPSPPEAAAHARAAMPCLLKRSKSDTAIGRAIAAPMIVEAVQKAQGTLDAETAEAAKRVIIADLKDPDLGVRSFTVDALGKFGDADIIPALQEVAANDPSPEVDGHSLRKDAVDAIAAIQERVGQRH